MGNDKQINQIINQAKSNFLRGEVVDTTREVIEYSLEKEFSKSKKNKRVLIVWAIIFFLVLLAGASFFTVQIIQQRQTNVQVDITEFEDLKLTELLKNSSSEKSRMKFLEQDIKQLKFQKDLELSQIYSETDQLIEIAKQKGMSPAETEAEIAALKKQGQAKAYSAESKYDSKIAMKQEEVDDIKQNLSTMKDAPGAASSGEEAAYSEYEKIFEIRLEKTKLYYEQKIKEMNKQHLTDISKIQKLHKELIRVLILKYNPVIKEDNVKSLLVAKGAPAGTSPEYNMLLGKENVLTKDEFDSLKKKAANFITIYTRIAAVPYTNTVPAALLSMKYYFDGTLKDYDMLWSKLLKTVEKKNKLIDTYEYAFEYFTKIGRESGYILDPRDSKKIVVYINKAYPIKKGDTAIVFRNDDEYIGKIKLDPQADAVIAEIIELAEGEQILPLDRILVNIK
ncbi:MAG: hypothetical protein A2Y33_07885 [Spirochaetes bacterium GWF1_51_8]|nr:MAG: hypothetical protein A2Y33_07885 [Spirochaetes bacterium GWF1_51_8]